MSNLDKRVANYIQAIDKATTEILGHHDIPMPIVLKILAGLTMAMVEGAVQGVEICEGKDVADSARQGGFIVTTEFGILVGYPCAPGKHDELKQILGEGGGEVRVLH